MSRGSKNRLVSKTLRRSKIAGVGYFVPPNKVSNDDLIRIYKIDTSDEWIRQRTGIESRYFVDAETTNADLGVEAAKNALRASNIEKSEIDFLIYCTLSPDHEFPGTGCFFQAKLGIAGVPSMDIRNQCTGFLYALSVADAYVKSGLYRKILVVGSEVHSRGLDLSTSGRDVSVLFGDGAGAAVVTESLEHEESEILSIVLHADGVFAKELWLEAPGCSFHPFRVPKNMWESRSVYPAMNGKVVFTHAVRKLPEVFQESLNSTESSLEDVDIFVPHQANLRINEAFAKQLNLSSEKVFNTIQKFGNTTAATIPIGLTEAVAQGRLKPGMIVSTPAFGSGFTWGAALIRW